MGTTTIHVTFGGEPRSKTLMVSFMVVKLPSAYNAIIGRIGRPTLNRLRAIVSTYHRILKFPTRAGVGEVRSDPKESRQYYLTATTLCKKPRAESIDATPRGTEESTRLLLRVAHNMKNFVLEQAIAINPPIDSIAGMGIPKIDWSGKETGNPTLALALAAPTEDKVDFFLHYSFN
ncbi:hypothetical protein B296_00053290 [Ensete ventricosum]|uniref:Uncharacterized protein n=1 Tax=Ensete ventricosum TaxID=4639 RepID=A0A426X293_ENSVE|nr:hypothetical protein B296_00053290 [Ensete ventricosum]